LPTGFAGGANAWVEIATSHAEATPEANHVLIDGVAVPVVRVTTAGEKEHTLDAAAGQLTPRQRTEAQSENGPAHVIAFRVPAGLAAGPHSIRLQTCNTTSEDHVAFEILPNPAPAISSIRLVRGEVWPALIIKGSNLSGAEEVILAAADGTVSALGNVTRIDDGQLRVPVEKSGTYDVFVRSANGLGGGPPNGMITVR
jgi:hypothetical protein